MGICTIRGHLPSEVAFVKKEAKTLLNINNAQCKKMVKKIYYKLHRKIVAKAITITG